MDKFQLHKVFISSLMGATLGITGLSSNLAPADTFYKWTDAEGVTHYDKRAPTEGTATQVRTQSQTASDSARGESQSTEQKQQRTNEKKAAEDKKQQASTADEAKNNQELLKQNCEQAKQNLATLNSSPRVREKDAQGNLRFLAPEEHQQKLNEAQKYLNDNCSEPKKP